MIIEWLNSEFTRARVTRRAWPKFWQKVEAIVFADAEEIRKYQNPPWYYEGTDKVMVEGCYVGVWHSGLAKRLARERKWHLDAPVRARLAESDRKRVSAWKPVEKPVEPEFPAARLLKKGES